MEQYIHWALGTLFILLLGAFRYTHLLSGKIDDLSKFVYQLPCVSTDVETKLATLEKRLDDLTGSPKDAIGFQVGGNYGDDDVSIS